MYRQKPYITVHDYRTPQADFERNLDGNGLAILMPTVCKITEELNGTYELYLEHPFDDEGRWRHLEIDNIICAGGQLFRIKQRKTKMNNKGDKIRGVQALHIWYDLADKNVYNYVANQWSGFFIVQNFIGALNSINLPNPQGKVEDFDHNEPHPDDVAWYRDYDFGNPATDLPALPSADYDNNGLGSISLKTGNLVQLMIGNESSVTNIYSKTVDGVTQTPELHRDNFHYSYYMRKEGAQDDAFSIVHTIDMIDIEETYDASDIYTHMYARDNFDGEYRARIDVAALRAKGIRVPPHARLKQLELQYNADEYTDFNAGRNARRRFNQDCARYFRSISQPKLTLRCNYAELSDTDLYKDYIAAKHCNVGDSGHVFCAELGVDQTVKVIRKSWDLVNPEQIEITFGSKLASITDGQFMGQSINTTKFTNTPFFSVVNT